MKKILLTGAAGFVGYHVARRLLQAGTQIVGIDNLNDYYDVGLKQARLDQIKDAPGFRFQRLDIADAASLGDLMANESFDCVVHLAAQAGVRYSLTHPAAYIESNLVGFANILEACRHNGLPPLLFASSSSVYGASERLPWSVSDNVDHPVSLYAATKKSNELLAHAYAHLYGLPCTGLRFFTVYGPWGRPDMAYFKFTQAILAGRPIEVFNHGAMERDFTYIDDIIEAIVRLIDKPATSDPGWNAVQPDPASSSAPYRVYNIGNQQPVNLLSFIGILEHLLDRRADMRLLPMQPGDVVATYANVEALRREIDFSPRTPLDLGLARFTRWFRDYYRV